MSYQFQHDYMRFSEGGLDEKLAYDRYSTPEHDIAKINIGDIVVCKLDRNTDKRIVGELIDKTNIEKIKVKTRVLMDDGIQYEEKEFHHELISKPLDLKPVDFWTRWAKAGASVEKEEIREKIEDEFRWLFDGYKCSPGGRVQLAAGQEFVTGKKANLSLFNCFVIPSPSYDKSDWEKAATEKEYAKKALCAIIENAVIEAQIMARGGGVGYSASTIPPKILGAGSSKKDIILYLPKNHKDYEILQDQIKLGKFQNVTIVNEKSILSNNYKYIQVEDSREDLLLSAKQMAFDIYDGKKVFIDFSKIRHKGALVKGVNGRSSGTPSWMILYDVIAELLHMKFYDAVDTMEIQSYVVSLIEQGGSRRGALLIELSDWHPNIKKFITRKQTFGKITGANVSIGISNEFMKLIKESRNGINTQKHKETSEIWQMIIESAWKSAEPGVIFMERYNDESNSWYYAPIIATNPCLHKDSYLVTENGLEKISNLKSKIHNTQTWVNSNSWKTGVKPTIKIMTNSGFEYIVTPNHKFLLSDGSWEEASKLIGKKIKFDLSEKNWIGSDPHNGNVDYRVLGFLLGDGEWDTASNRINRIFVTPGKDQEVIDIIEKEFGWSFKWENEKYQISVPINTPYADTFEGKIETRDIPDWILQLPKKEMSDFLCGLFSANGTNLKKYSKVQLVSINKKMLLKVQQMLLLFGIKAKLWYHNKSQDIQFSNGTYTCKESYHLVISRKSYVKFIDNINFIQSYKKGYENKNYKDEDDYEQVILISENEECEVWDFSEPTLNRGIYSGAIVHNCGEQGLPAWGVCNLQHLVLSRFYDKEKNDVQWDELRRAIRACIRFQDNIIDYTNYFTKENEKQQKSERRIGMGTMGLATLMIKLGLRYGSDESCKFIDKLYKFIAVEAYKTSIDLAVEKGKFPKCEPEKMANGFIRHLLPELPNEYREKFFATGIRNVTLLTQAPTGSTGTYIDNLLMQYNDGTSTGIEPYFAFEYYRVSRSGSAVKQELGLAKNWKKNNPNKPLPDYFVTAQDLSPDDHVKVQAAIQKWVDSSISKTANCPEDFTIEDTKRLYELAYELGCKGVTIYRANSRKAQVLSTDKEKAKLETDIEEEKLKQIKKQENKNTRTSTIDKTSFIKKRPKRLYGFTDKINFNYGDRMGRAYVTINSDEQGNPWEVFISTKEKDVSSLSKALGLMTTKLLRLGCTSDNLQQAIDTLTYDQTMGTLPFQVANILKQIQKEILIKESNKTNELKLAKCPSCDEEKYDKANCICYACGISHCN